MSDGSITPPPPPASSVVARPVYAPSPSIVRPHEPWFFPAELNVSRQNAAIDLLLLLFAAVIVHYVPGVIAAAVGLTPPQGAGGVVDFLVVAGKWLEAALVAVIALHFVVRGGYAPRAIGLRTNDLPIQIGWSAATLIAVYAYLFGTVLLFAAFMFAAPGGEKEIARRVEFMRQLPIDDLATTVALLIPVALHEELLFRGLMLPILQRVLGSWTAAIAVTAVIFGVLHFPQGWIAMIQITGLSVVLSVMFLWSRSLLAVVLAHFLFDFFQLQLMRLFGDFLPTAA